MTSLQDFVDTGALLEGHFRLSSGLHSDRYLQCARLLMWPARAEAAGRDLASRLTEFGPKLIVSPAMGGVVIGHETARALGIPFLFAERVDGAFALRRGFRLEPGDLVAVVEDVFTTGKSTREVVELCAASKARVLAAGSIVDRGMPAAALTVPSRSLLSLSVPAWPQGECPLCKEGRPLETPGSRFAAAKP
ncbi:MAG TPA: orotate phosphoribosyltransferase [Thermoanaerobaculia bacterium]|nr:orotate phosphoribosyltransferase [Thermoanaerobaculia bacterium]